MAYECLSTGWRDQISGQCMFASWAEMNDLAEESSENAVRDIMKRVYNENLNVMGQNGRMRIARWTKGLTRVDRNELMLAYEVHNGWKAISGEDAIFPFLNGYLVIYNQKYCYVTGLTDEVYAFYAATSDNVVLNNYLSCDLGFLAMNPSREQVFHLNPDAIKSLASMNIGMHSMHYGYLIYARINGITSNRVNFEITGMTNHLVHFQHNRKMLLDEMNLCVRGIKDWVSVIYKDRDCFDFSIPSKCGCDKPHTIRFTCHKGINVHAITLFSVILNVVQSRYKKINLQKVLDIIFFRFPHTTGYAPHLPYFSREQSVALQQLDFSGVGCTHTAEYNIGYDLNILVKNYIPDLEPID